VRLVETLVEQWDAILAVEPTDWSHLSLELRLADPDRMEDATAAASPLNPWRRDDDWRSGAVRFLAARTAGYGAAPALVRARLALLDQLAIGGSLQVLRSLDAVRLVSTQGPT
jgi:hypothetical protein